MGMRVSESSATSGLVLSAVLACGLGGCGGSTRGTSQAKDGPPSAGGGQGTSHLDGGMPDAAPALSLDREVPRSGSRIQVTVWSAGGEWIAETGVRDTEQGVACSLARAADGEERCLPPESDRVRFLDAECTKPVLLAPRELCDGSRDRMVRYREFTTCGEPRWFVVSYGEPVAPPALYGAGSGSCIEGPVESTVAYYEARESEASDWVAYERYIDEINDELAVETWRGTDGSALSGGFRMMPADAPCEPQSNTGSTGPGTPYHCLPTARASRAEGYFTDASCGNGTVMRAADCSAPLLVEEPPEYVEECQALRLRYFEVGQELEPTTLFWTFFDRPCEPSNAAFVGAYRYHLAGPPVPMERYPALALAPRASGGLRPYVWWADGVETGVGPPPGSAVDEDGNACRVLSLENGDRRCIPGEERALQYFADPACREPLHGSLRSCSPPPDVRWVYQPSSYDQCLGTVVAQVRALGVEHAGAAYQLSDGACVELGIATGSPLFARFFTLGAVVDPSIFPEVVEVTR